MQLLAAFVRLIIRRFALLALRAAWRVRVSRARVCLSVCLSPLEQNHQNLRRENHVASVCNTILPP